MNFFDFIPFLTIFGVIAYYDWKTKDIPDIFTAFCWLIIAIQPYNHTATVFIFALLFIFNTVLLWVSKKEALGWGDVLLIPLFATFIFKLPHYSILTTIPATIGFCAPHIISALRKEEVAVMPWLFASAFLTWLLTYAIIWLL